MPNPPDRIGDYELLEQIGRGGMGVVYRARHVHLERQVALKVLSPALSSQPQALARFQREIKALGKLDHANVAEASDARQEDGQWILVMRYIDGIDLHRLIQERGRCTIPAACEAVRQAALGLEYVHRQGLVHRDVKPSNLMLTSDGTIKLLDLGLAALRDDPSATHLSESGLQLGTADYMAPEQFQNPSSVDHRADLYSLGCTLYHLLTGSAPYAGPDHAGFGAKAAAHIHEPYPDVRDANPDVPDELYRILTTLVAKRPEDRFSSAARVAEALQPMCDIAQLATAGVETTAAYAHGETVADSPPARRGLWRRFGLMTVLSVIVAAAVLVIRGQISDPPPPPPAPVSADSSPSDSPREADDPDPELPTALALIPPDAAGFISVRWSDWPAADSRSPLLLAALGNSRFDDSELEMSLIDAIRTHQFVRIDPWYTSPLFWKVCANIWSSNFSSQDSMERLTMVFLAEPILYRWFTTSEGIEFPVPIECAWIATSREPYQRESILERVLGQDPTERSYAGHDYFHGGEPELAAVHFVDDHTWVVARPAIVLQQLFDHLSATDGSGALEESLRMAAAGPEITIGINPAWSAEERFGATLPPPFDNLDYRPIAQFQSATVTVDVVDPDADGAPTWNTEIMLHFTDESTAARIAPNVENVVVAFPSPFPPRLKFPDPESLRLGFEASWQFQNALREAQVRQEQSDLRVSWHMETSDSDPTGTMQETVTDLIRRRQNHDSLHAIGLAMHVYHDRVHAFPPPVLHGENGDPLLSWRVLILPDLGEDELFSRFRLDEPWDSAHNASLIEEMPSVYEWQHAPGDSDGMTRIQVIVGAESAFPPPTEDRRARAAVEPSSAAGVRIADFTDGTGNILFAVISPEPVPWTKPADVMYSSDGPTPVLHHLPDEGPLVLFADGRVRHLHPNLPEEAMRALITRNGGEAVDIGDADDQGSPANR